MEQKVEKWPFLIKLIARFVFVSFEFTWIRVLFFLYVAYTRLPYMGVLLF